MTESTVLVTGASGEIGQALVDQLSKQPQTRVISLDLKPLPGWLEGKSHHIVGDLLDKALLNQLEETFTFSQIFHLAAVLSTTAEGNPYLAHQVNTCITLDLLDLAARQSQQLGERVQFIFPSSIAVYGLQDLAQKMASPPLRENQYLQPRTMYGCSKLYCENVGRYYSEDYQQLSDPVPVRVDFRAIRFPGIISAFTVPSGGTSDFGPEMIHAAAQGKPYSCFVREDVRIPFMVMPDAVRGLIMLSNAPSEELRQRVYNITSFSFSAADFAALTRKGFPEAEISFDPDPARQAIVDSWPADVDDQAARGDWGWEPKYDADCACQDYLLKNIITHYS